MQITELYHKVNKPQLFEGITKTYEAIEVNGEELPSRLNSSSSGERGHLPVPRFMGPVLDTTLTQDIANTRARADVEVDGVTILPNVPVTISSSSRRS